MDLNLIVCTLMAVMFLHTFLTAGGLQGVQIEHGIFPGGELAYKFASRDYAAAPSLVEYIAKEAGLGKPNSFADCMYSVYFDDPRGLGRPRFAAGYLATDKETRKRHRSLLDKNAKTSQEAAKGNDQDELAVLDLWSIVKYESASLPSVNCGVAHFPNTNGFVSALILQYKVIPALRRYAAENSVDKNVGGSGPIVISSCSISQGMCTHYVPLIKSKQFHLGRPNSTTFFESHPAEPWFDWEGMKSSIRKYVPGGSLLL